MRPSLFLLWILLLTTASLHAAVPAAATARAQAIAPLLDERTIVVASVSLGGLDVDATIAEAVRLVPDLAAVQPVVKASASAVLNQFRFAGANPHTRARRVASNAPGTAGLLRA